MKPYERLLKYIAIRTPSDEESTTVPSSACQFELAQHLLRELFTMGITDAKVDTKCYLPSARAGASSRRICSLISGSSKAAP